MKKTFVVILFLFIISCGKEETTGEQDGKLKVVYVVNGVLGDQSFIDSAARGLRKAEADLGINLKIIESGLDVSKWKSSLEDAAANEDYDILVAGSSSMQEYMESVASKYPDKKFIIYDSPVSYSEQKYDNVYSVAYKQNEGSYILGVYAGLMTTNTALNGINADKKLGVIGAQDIPAINDFIYAFKQGAQSVGVEEVFVQYAGGWNDPAKGKELSLALYRQGVDIIFQVAGGTGSGVFQAALESGTYALGVDSDQYLILVETNPDHANTIISSMIKNVDNSLYRAIEKHLEGTLVYGQAEVLGIPENGVGIAQNDYYNEVTPDSIKESVAKHTKDILDGNIEVITAF